MRIVGIKYITPFGHRVFIQYRLREVLDYGDGHRELYGTKYSTGQYRLHRMQKRYEKYNVVKPQKPKRHISHTVGDW